MFCTFNYKMGKNIKKKSIMQESNENYMIELTFAEQIFSFIVFSTLSITGSMLYSQLSSFGSPTQFL